MTITLSDDIKRQLAETIEFSKKIQVRPYEEVKAYLDKVALDTAKSILPGFTDKAAQHSLAEHIKQLDPSWENPYV